MNTSEQPPMDPNTSEATQKQLDLAKEQGEAYGRALKFMTGTVANDGGQQEAGEYLIGYAVEEAEGMYEWMGAGNLHWHAPEDENLHVEVVVCDASDGRFIPVVKAFATLIDPDGNDLGTHEQPLMWHPMMYHYGRNWTVPKDGTYTLKIRVEPPTIHRHDEVNGKRFTEPVEVEFTNVKVKRGQD